MFGLAEAPDGIDDPSVPIADDDKPGSEDTAIGMLDNELDETMDASRSSEDVIFGAAGPLTIDRSPTSNTGTGTPGGQNTSNDVTEFAPGVKSEELNARGSSSGTSLRFTVYTVVLSTNTLNVQSSSPAGS